MARHAPPQLKQQQSLMETIVIKLINACQLGQQMKCCLVGLAEQPLDDTGKGHAALGQQQRQAAKSVHESLCRITLKNKKVRLTKQL